MCLKYLQEIQVYREIFFSLPYVLNCMSNAGFTRASDLTWMRVVSGIADLLTANVLNSGFIQFDSIQQPRRATYIVADFTFAFHLGFLSGFSSGHR